MFMSIAHVAAFQPAHLDFTMLMCRPTVHTRDAQGQDINIARVERYFHCRWVECM